LYPIRIRFHGIRDFQPAQLGLGEEGEHVLIGGRNGSGKSTIVYALSLAMASSSTHIWSLRSKNLEEDQPWDAFVGVLFHNPSGPEQKDAPEYVECVVEVNAGDTSRYSVKYSVFGGIHPDRMERLRVFSTRIAAEDYYRRVFNIDADGYFMFWYQGSITDFANISDGERFQRVSEMFGIDRYEAEWKRAREALVDGERSLIKSKQQKEDNERNLRIHEKNRNDLLTRNSIRDEGLAGTYHTSQVYIQILNQRQEELDKQVKEQGQELEKIATGLKKKERFLRDKDRSKEILLRDKARLTENIELVKGKLREIEPKLRSNREDHTKLVAQVDKIREEIKRVRPREALQSLKGSLEERIDHIHEKNREIKGEQDEKNSEYSRLDQEMGGLRQRRKDLENKLIEEENSDRTLPPMMEITMELEGYQDELQGTQVVLAEDRIRVKELETRLQELEATKSLMTRGQKKLVDAFRSTGIEAAAFGELFDIANHARRDEVEALLAPIKHTVFVSSNMDGRVTEGGFYVVSTDDFVDQMGSGDILDFISIPSDVTKEYSPEFLKGVLGWISQIQMGGSANQGYSLVIADGILIDSHGVRGTIKKGPAIGLKALESEKEGVKQELSRLKIKVAAAERDVKELDVIIQDMRNDLQQRQQVDKRLPLTRKALEDVLERQGENSRKREELNKQLQELNTQIGTLIKEKTKYENDLEQVEKELSIHQEHQQQAEKIARLEELAEMIRVLDNTRRIEQDKRSRYSQQMNGMDQELIQLENEKTLINAQLSNFENRQEDLKGRQQKANDELNNVILHLRDLKDGLQKLSDEFGDIYKKAIEKELKLDLITDREKISDKYLGRQLTHFKYRIQDAQNRRVLENAEERYNTFLKIFNESASQLEESLIRFKELKRDEENRRDDLNKMINRRYLDTNRLFREYMSMLDLEGEIRSLAPREGEADGRYRWEILVATREGHRLERIDRESSRRGRKGSGISGGERAATSLMFALSLLSQIHVKPPFYVLDEFDSALDEGRKHKILDLYSDILKRKMLIVSPKIHGKDYLDRFGKFHCVYSNPDIQKHREISEVYEITRLEYEDVELEV